MTEKLRRLSSLLFGRSERVSRQQYTISGFSLMTLKYVVDAAIVYAAIWSPLSYLTPLASVRLNSLPQKLVPTVALVLWCLPFIWIGVSMTFRRAVDGGLPRWFGLLFVVPVINYLVMLELCFERVLLQ